MELEDDLKRLRFAEASAALRRRILNDVEASAQRAVIPPWLAALERHWLYPGRKPALALVLAWLVIASLRFSTPVFLMSEPHTISALNEDQLVQLEQENARLLVDLQRADFEPADAPPPRPSSAGWLPPRS